VRGGNVVENLIIMDEAPVFNSSHLLGFFSVFNPDAVKNVTLYKNAFPAEYGGRTSSVLDIRMKEGNNQKLAVNGGVSNVFSRLSVEGPIQKDKSSFIIAARRSYIDVLSKPFLSGDSKNNVMYFYDITAKGNVKLNENNTLYLSGYFGQDVFSFNNQADFKWGNTTGTLRWNHRSATPLVAAIASSRLRHVLLQAELETFAVEADGTVAWRIAHSDVVTAAELVGGRLVLTSYSGQVNAIDPATGRAPG